MCDTTVIVSQLVVVVEGLEAKFVVTFSCSSSKTVTQTEAYVAVFEWSCSLCWSKQHGLLSLENLHFLKVPLKMGN